MIPLLFDNNLSRRLVSRLSDVYPQCLHVSQVALESASDDAVWRFAGERGCMLVSKDNDFQSLALSRGAPPKVVILLIGNGPTAHAEAVLRRAQTRLEDFADSEDTVLMLRDPFTFT